MGLSNSLFYSLSTISQTLAAIAGITVVVVLYQLQLISSRLPGKLEKSGVRYREDTRNLEHQIDLAVATDDWPKVIQLLDDSPLKETGLTPNEISGFKTQHNSIKADVHKLQSVKARLKSPLLWTGVTIALSLFLLPLTPCITTVTWLAIAVLTVTTVLALVSLYLYGPLIIQVTK